MSKIQTYKYIPKFVFIVPYRDREKHKEWFINNIKDVANKNNHFFELYFIHQNDSRIFNRGAMKNFGFIFIKKKYSFRNRFMLQSEYKINGNFKRRS